MAGDYGVQTKKTGKQDRHPLSYVPNSVNRLDENPVRLAAEKNYFINGTPGSLMMLRGWYSEVNSMDYGVTLERKVSFLGEAC